MTLRRLGLAVPLAVLVAVLAHVVGFGAEHAPGAAHAAGLLTTLGVALGLAALVTLFAAALRADRRDGASPQQDRWLPLFLALGGAVAYGAIELAEGHTPLGGGAGALVSLVPAAALVSGLARLASRMLRLSGMALAALVPASSRRLPRFAPAPARRPDPAGTTHGPGAHFGRAPPTLA